MTSALTSIQHSKSNWKCINMNPVKCIFRIHIHQEHSFPHKLKANMCIWYFIYKTKFHIIFLCQGYAQFSVIVFFSFFAIFIIITLICIKNMKLIQANNNDSKLWSFLPWYTLFVLLNGEGRAMAYSGYFKCQDLFNCHILSL